MVRTYIQLPEDVHAYLAGVAHEQSLAGGRRVSVSAVVQEICKVAVDEMRQRETKGAPRV